MKLRPGLSDQRGRRPLATPICSNKNTKRNRMKYRIPILLWTLVLVIGVRQVSAQGTAFTYQGRLSDGSQPANGNYDLTFSLFGTSNAGSQVGFTLTHSAVGVSNGLFTVLLDFGIGVFTGADRWLEISVRTNGSGAFAVLNPRQPVTAAPYAVTAGNLTGVVPSSGVSGTYSNAVTFGNSANQFAGAFYGSGGGLSNVDATSLGGVAYSNFWRIGGNAGVATNRYIGTTDYQPLEMRVNNLRAIGILPTLSGWPNIVGGAPNNYILPDDTGATISGGVINGIGNTCGSSIIGGGRNNLLQINAAGSFIGGGQWNLVGDGSVRSVISGGYSNRILGFTGTNGAAIARDVTDGTSNTLLIGETVGNATIGGGYANTIGSNCVGSVIGGGHRNFLGDGSVRSVISGGSANVIGGGEVLSNDEGGGGSAFIGGGSRNTIGSNCAGADI